jgi:Amiloride-sensitive sodium channel
MTVITFVANTGGLLGLCLGMSFVSVFEALYFVVTFSWAKIYKFNLF